MKLEKVKEILQLNIMEAGKKMPPDVKTALQIALAAVQRYSELRSRGVLLAWERLPGETDDNGGH